MDDYRNILLEARNIILKHIDYLERESSHTPLTNYILANYHDEFPESILTAVLGNINPNGRIDRANLFRCLSSMEKLLGSDITTSDIIKQYKKKISTI